MNPQNKEKLIEKNISLENLADKIRKNYETKISEIENAIGVQSLKQKQELLKQIQNETLSQNKENIILTDQEKENFQKILEQNIFSESSSKLDKLKNELENQKSGEKNNIYIGEKNTNQEEKNDKTSVTKELKNGGIGFYHTLKEIGNFSLNLGKGILNTPKDLYLLATGKAEYKTPRPKKDD